MLWQRLFQEDIQINLSVSLFGVNGHNLLWTIIDNECDMCIRFAQSYALIAANISL